MSDAQVRLFTAALPRLATVPLSATLVRCVSQIDFDKGDPRTYLYRSGLANRYNPAGVPTFYFSEEKETAEKEHEGQWIGTDREHEPVVLYRARVKLQRVLDLGNAKLREELSLTDQDLYGNWWRLPQTRLQSLGAAIAEQSAVTAIRYPSAAARLSGSSGWNVAIYPSALRAPDRVEILGRGTTVLETVP